MIKKFSPITVSAYQGFVHVTNVQIIITASLNWASMYLRPLSSKVATLLHWLIFIGTVCNFSPMKLRTFYLSSIQKHIYIYTHI